MKLPITSVFLPFTAAALLAFTAGCSQQTINSANNDASHDIAAANQAVTHAAQQAKPKLNALGVGARVTAAIQANENLPHDTIRVDASSTGVRLRGTVKTPAQKALASRVASDTLGPDKTVDNELTVSD